MDLSKPKRTASFYRPDKSSSSTAIVSHSGYGTCAHIVISQPGPLPRNLPVGKQTKQEQFFKETNLFFFLLTNLGNETAFGWTYLTDDALSICKWCVFSEWFDSPETGFDLMFFQSSVHIPNSITKLQKLLCFFCFVLYHKANTTLNKL